MKSSNTNLFLAVILIMGFMVFWESFVGSKYKEPVAPPASATAQTDGVPSQPIRERKPQIQPRIELPTGASNPSEVQEIKFENENNKVVFETQGARILSWQIKENDRWVELVLQGHHEMEKPLGTYSSQLNFKHEKLTGQAAQFTSVHPDGFIIRKKFELSSNSPLHKLTVVFENNSDSTIQLDSQFGWGSGLAKAVVDSEESAKIAQAVEAEMKAVGYAGKFQKWKPGFFSKTMDRVQPGPFEWVGVDNDHFMAAFIPSGNPISQVHVGWEKNVPPSIQIPVKAQIGPGERFSESYDLFVGAKKYSELKQIGHNLDSSVDFGLISKSLIFMLQFFTNYTNNYGWSIIILTLCVQVLVFPLTRKSLQSSLKMKAVQPQLSKIKEQYKNDPKRLQIEQLNLFRKNGLKYMGMEGCLPVLIQLPIFFAIFKVLRVAYELRGAPWIFWIHDLAAPDQFYVLPIVMGIGMFLQQKLTTATADPIQAKMMYIFPVMMTVFFLSMPAGLILYWTTQSLTTIFVQRYLMWSHPPKALQPAPK